MESTVDTMDTYLIPSVCSGLRGHSRYVILWTYCGHYGQNHSEAESPHKG